MVFTESQKWMTLALFVLTGYLLYLLAPVLTPFAFAAVLAYLGDPAVDWLEERGLSRTLGVVVVFLIITLITVIGLLVIVPLLEEQIRSLVRLLPKFVEWAKGHVGPLLERVQSPDGEPWNVDKLIVVVQDHLKEAGGFAAGLLGSLSKSGLAMIAWVMNMLLVPVVAFYLLRDWDILVGRVRELLPRKIEPTVIHLTRESDSVLGAFMRGQLTVMIALGVIYSLGLWFVGIELSLLIGMGAGLVSFVPYLGAIVGMAVGVIAALFQFGDWTHVLMVLAVFGVGQLLEGMILTPLLVGDRIGLHPVAVIFAVLAGGQLFGFLGVLLALPVASVAMVLLRYAHERYKQSAIYDTAKPPDEQVEAEPAALEAGEDSGEDGLETNPRPTEP